MYRNIKAVLVGIGGYGNVYLEHILSEENTKVELVGVVDVTPNNSAFFDEITNRDIPIFKSLEDFYATSSADLAIISTPIHLHKAQSCYALQNGSHVLCEKPMTANIEDIKPMIHARDQYDKFLAIGFNWSFTSSVIQLKKDILSGVFGKPIRMKTIIRWPRDLNYYERSNWAGKKYGAMGEHIFDSVANNATAHFLHHLLYMVGDSLESSATISTIQSELYRVNPIETFDTCAAKLITSNGVELYYYATHAVEENHDPEFVFQFDHAIITYHPNKQDGQIIATLDDGTVIKYENPENNHLSKLHLCIEEIEKGTQNIPCGPEAATAHVKCIEEMHKGTISPFPNQFIRFNKENRMYFIPNLGEDLYDCYEQWRLPFELRKNWSVAAMPFSITN